MRKREICLSVKCETKNKMRILGRIFYFSVCPDSLQRSISPLTDLNKQTSEFV